MCLPHKDLTQYAFVLKPMQEIAGDLIHPKIGTSFAELWQHFESQISVKRISFEWDVPPT